MNIDASLINGLKKLDWTWKVLLCLAFGQAVFGCVYLYIAALSLLGRLPPGMNWLWHEVLETIAMLTMCASLVIFSLVLLKIYRREKRFGRQIETVSGQFADVVLSEFKKWKLSTSEREIALLVLKGFTNQEIADLRGTAAGTIKSQMNTIYRKTGLKSRNQFVSYFVEELIAGVDTAAV